MTYRKKLIEVALPLEAINKESAREKSIRHGHPSTLHLWWSRKPLATCRAVLFAQLVDDSSSHPEQFPTEEAQEKERQRLFRIIEELVKWENSNNEQILGRARAEIRKSCGGNPPPVLDPFCGGGSIPLEAQRLGLEAHASDLNPVAVLITKALIEIPPKFANRPPVHPNQDTRLLEQEWYGAQGLAEDIRYYGQWLRDEAEKRIGHLYPKVKISPSSWPSPTRGEGSSILSPSMGEGKEEDEKTATVIAWLWARTVKCPNPACRAQMPLISKLWLSNKRQRKVWLEPVLNKREKTVHFEVKTGEPHGSLVKKIEAGTSATNSRGKKIKATFTCVICNAGIAKGDYIDAEANKGRMGVMPLAIIAEGDRNRIFLSFDEAQVQTAQREPAQFLSDLTFREKFPTEPARGTFASNAQGRVYGFKTFADYFTLRQLLALTTFCDLVGEVQERVLDDAFKAGMSNDRRKLGNGDIGMVAYSDAIAIYLALAMDRMVDRHSTLTRWDPHPTTLKIANTFARQGLLMTWDYTEGNPFSRSSGNLTDAVDWISKVVVRLPISHAGIVQQLDAAAITYSEYMLISTDPPYYDNVSYADLSDFFYVWLRRSLVKAYPELFTTLLVPKAQELVATPYRFGGNAEKAKAFFEEELGRSFACMREVQHPDYPLTVFYAFKQVETDKRSGEEVSGSSTTASTGWETMLEGLLKADFTITGTWPIRTELANRTVGLGANALASSIVLVCRPRPEDARPATRREFLAALKRELPEALRLLQHGNIAPVDLAQAAIGPGMAVFSRYSKVLEADGSPMRVRTALALINQTLDEVLAEQEGEFDSDTRWAVAWFEQHGFEEGIFGVAETLSKAKNTAVSGMVEAGILSAKAGKVRLLRRDELNPHWDPTSDGRLTAWETTQHLIRVLEKDGESGAAQLLAKLGSMGELARDLAYRLYTTCERKKWAQDALAFNSLVVSWPEIVRLAAQKPEQRQEEMFGEK
jgi:putative DNA methylase